MKNSLKKLKAWRAGRQLRSLQQWEQIRKKGKARYMVTSSLTAVLTALGVLDVVDNIFWDGNLISVFNVLYFLAFGLYSAHDGWNNMEGKYQIALQDARAAASTGGTLPPHNSPVQITVDSDSR